MSQSNVRVRPCKTLASLSLSALEKVLLQGFFLLGKKDQSFDTAIIGSPAHQDVISYLCERSRARPFEEMEAFLSHNLLESQRQTIVDDLMNLLATPLFDSERIASCDAEEFYLLYSDTEMEFKALNDTAKSKDMSEIIYYFLKYSLSESVTELDFSGFYTSAKRWVARNARIFLSWPEIKLGKQDITYFRNCDFLSTRTHFDGMLYDYLNNVNSGILKASPHFSRLLKINVDHVASGELIWAIGCHCPSLENLSLFIEAHDRSKYSTFFEKKLLIGMTSLIGHRKVQRTSFQGRPVGCPRLRRICLPQVEDEDALRKLNGLFLTYLIWLEELTGADIPGSIGASIQERKLVTSTLQLISIEELPYREHLQDFCDYFDVRELLPNVTKVTMTYNRLEGNLNLLSKFPKLEFLSVTSEGLCELEFSPHFKHLKELKSNCLWDEKKLAGLSQRAPSLEVFHLSEGAMLKRKKSRDPLSFPKMKEVRISEPKNCDHELFVSFLRSCKNLTRITLEVLKTDASICDMFTDKVVASIVPSLKKLQVITAKFIDFSMFDRYPTSNTTLAAYQLTEKSVYYFIYGCSDLISMGNIFHWKIPHQKILEIKREAQEKNWAVKIWPLDDL